MVVVVVVSSRHQGWVVGRTSWEASCTDSHFDAFLVHDLAEEDIRLMEKVEDRIDLEVAYTGPRPFLEGGSLLLEDSYTHSSRGALVDYSCPTSGVEDSSWWEADNFHGFSAHSEE